MNIEEALKIPGARDAIIKLAKAMEKRAGSNATTQFNETVPVLSTPANEKISGTGLTGTAQQANQSTPQMVDQAPPASVIPQEQQVAAKPQQINPAEEGAIAAQAFLGPIYEAAMNGDVNAQSIIAMTAGHIAKNTMLAASESLMSQKIPQDPNSEIVAQMTSDPQGAPTNSAQTAPGSEANLPPIPQQNSQAMMDQNGNPVDQNGNPVQVDAQGNPISAAFQEHQIADKIVPETTGKGSKKPVEQESGKDQKKKDDNKKKEGVQTDTDADGRKVASLNVEQLRGIINLARLGKI